MEKIALICPNSQETFFSEQSKSFLDYDGGHKDMLFHPLALEPDNSEMVKIVH